MRISICGNPKPSLAVLLALAAVAAHAQDVAFSGSAALTSDYVFRGISQTQGDPAAQAGVKLAHGSGIYGALWGSTVEFPGDSGASSEIDYTLGWAGTLADAWALDVNLTHFDYPSARLDLAYTELIATLTWRQNYWLMLGWSPDVFATDATGVYLQLGARHPLSDTFRLEFAAGHYDLDDAYNDSYNHAQLSAIWAFKAPFELRLSAHATDSTAEDLFPGLAESPAELALQASF